jgi:flagellar basal body-associated protein FliL
LSLQKKIIIIVIAVIAAVGIGVWIFTRPKPEPEPVAYSPGDYFITNVKDSNKLFKTDIIIELLGEDDVTLLQENNYIVRDTIVFVLSAQTEKDLRAQGAQDVLRETLIEELNIKLGIDSITAIYFNEYVVQ